MLVLPSQQHSQKRDCRCGRSDNVRLNIVLNREQTVPSLASFSISFSHAAPFETKHVLCNRLWNEPRGLAVGFDDDIWPKLNYFHVRKISRTFKQCIYHTQQRIRYRAVLSIPAVTTAVMLWRRSHQITDLA